MFPGLTLPKVFMPDIGADSVRKLRYALGMQREAVRLRVVTRQGDRDRDCYVNVQNRVNQDGGRMQLGWAVWQHSHLFIEAEPHAVLDPGNGQPWIDCTPHEGSPQEILFIPNDDATYDFNTTELPDNVRVALIDDPRLSKALKLYSEKNALMNSVPGVDIVLPQHVARKVLEVDVEAGMLLAELMGTPVGKGMRVSAQVVRAGQKVGRNDPCPCGSGKKYKKCCGGN
jgi:hypothetical protein